MQAGEVLPAVAVWATVSWADSGGEDAEWDAPPACLPLNCLLELSGVNVLPTRHSARLSADEAVEAFAGSLQIVFLTDSIQARFKSAHN